MSPEEAGRRVTVALERAKEKDPYGVLFFGLALFTASLVRGVLYVCVGFGAANLLGISAWWGPPLSLVGIPVGRLWGWARRSSLVAAAERLADASGRGVARGEGQ